MDIVYRVWIDPNCQIGSSEHGYLSICQIKDATCKAYHSTYKDANTFVVFDSLSNNLGFWFSSDVGVKESNLIENQLGQSLDPTLPIWPKHRYSLGQKWKPKALCQYKNKCQSKGLKVPVKRSSRHGRRRTWSLSKFYSYQVRLTLDSLFYFILFIFTQFLPGFTPLLQPLDVAVNKSFQSIYNDIFNSYLEQAIC